MAVNVATCARLPRAAVGPRGSGALRKEAARAREAAVTGAVPQVQLAGAQDGKRVRAPGRDDGLVDLVDRRRVGVLVGADLADELGLIHLLVKARRAARELHEHADA